MVHIIAQDLGQTTDWVADHYSADAALRYFRLCEYHPHPLRALLAALTRRADG